MLTLSPVNNKIKIASSNPGSGTRGWSKLIEPEQVLTAVAHYYNNPHDRARCPLCEDDPVVTLPATKTGNRDLDTAIEYILGNLRTETYMLARKALVANVPNFEEIDWPGLLARAAMVEAAENFYPVSPDGKEMKEVVSKL